jgi:hypothetical protein
MRRDLGFVLAACSAACALACSSGGDKGASLFGEHSSQGSGQGETSNGWSSGASFGAAGSSGAGGSAGTGSPSPSGGSSGSGSGAATSSGAMGPGTGAGTGSGSGTPSSNDDAGVSGPGTPPFASSSGGTGGAVPVEGTTVTASSITYYLIVPSTYVAGTPNPLLVVFSGTEGAAQMTENLMNLSQTGIAPFICAVLDGVQYYGDGSAGATALDDVRSKYDVDDDRTYLLGESAGTSAALQLGFHLRQSYFAAYWANDVNASDTPGETSAQLGFQPWGQAGPGGDLPDADSIVSAMQAAGYRLPNPAPYAGQGSTMHGDLDQFVAAVSFFPGLSRQ